MKLIEVLENQKLEYNRFVTSSETGSFLQGYEWGEWQKKLGREVFRFWVLDNNTNPIFSIQLVKMPLPLNQYYLYAPYGPVINLGFRNEDLRFLLQKLQKKFPKAIFIKFESKSNFAFNILHFPFIKSSNIQPAKTLVVDLSQNPEELLASMHHKTRYNIKLAEKHGVVVKHELVVTPGHGLYFAEVVNQIVDTAKRQNYKSHGAEYYKQLVDFFALQTKNSAIKILAYKALSENLLLASGLMVDFGNTRTYLFGGSSEEKKNLMAPYLLHFQAMKDAKNLGLTNYDFWGIETSAGKEAGFARFKLGFGGRVLEYGGAWDIVFKPTKYFGYKLLKTVRRIIKK